MIVGYRLFRTDFGFPASITFVGHKWISGWNRAGTCMLFGTPEEEVCSGIGAGCGFYAFKREADAIIQGRFQNPQMGIVLVAVEMAGTVVEHDLGYRAEYMRVLAVIGDGPNERFCAEFFGVPFERE